MIACGHADLERVECCGGFYCFECLKRHLEKDHAKLKVFAKLQYGGSDLYIDGLGWEIVDGRLQLILCTRSDMNTLKNYVQLSEGEYKEVG